MDTCAIYWLLSARSWFGSRQTRGGNFFSLPPHPTRVDALPICRGVMARLVRHMQVCSWNSLRQPRASWLCFRLGADRLASTWPCRARSCATQSPSFSTRSTKEAALSLQHMNLPVAMFFVLCRQNVCNDLNAAVGKTCIACLRCVCVFLSAHICMCACKEKARIVHSCVH